ncbi:hypothetical protein F2981_10395 [Sinorhizobium meliloti]|nr:hypothetical protein [Sinorhizobium meliloti]
MRASSMTSFDWLWRRIAVLFFGAVQQWQATPLLSRRSDGPGSLCRKPDTLHHPASLTRWMTLYMTFEASPWPDRLENACAMSVTAARKRRRSIGVKPEERSPSKSCLRMDVRSANDAAARWPNGWRFRGRLCENDERKSTPTRMNRTFFVNASGLPASEQVTTARDMARLPVALMRHYRASTACSRSRVSPSAAV